MDRFRKTTFLRSEARGWGRGWHRLVASLVRLARALAAGGERKGAGVRREQRERVQQTMARWRTPGARKALDRWLDYLDLMHSEREEEAQQMVREELLRQQEELEAARTQDVSMVERKLQDEVNRRMETCKRVVKRMLHHQLVLAWDTFVDSVMTVKANRETVRRVLARMTHRQVT